MPPSTEPASARPPFRNILIVRQHDQLGDMLCAVPLMRALRQSSPDAHIALVTSPVNHKIMLNHPYLDEVIEYDKRKLFSSGQGVLNVLGRVRSRPYDLAIVPSTVSVSSTSNLIARLSGATVRCGARSLDGVPNTTAWCFNVTVELSWGNAPHLHQTSRNLAVLTPLGISTDDLSHRIGLTQEELERARHTLGQLRKDHRFVIRFHPGAGKPPNRWSAERFAGLANHAARKYEAGIVVTQGPMDDR
jgi:ADP-heptose:LPS heptosyltransferase